MTASLSKDHRLALFEHRPLFGHVARSDMAVGDLLWDIFHSVLKYCKYCVGLSHSLWRLPLDFRWHRWHSTMTAFQGPHAVHFIQFVGCLDSGCATPSGGVWVCEWQWHSDRFVLDSSAIWGLNHCSLMAVRWPGSQNCLLVTGSPLKLVRQQRLHVVWIPCSFSFSLWRIRCCLDLFASQMAQNTLPA